MTTLTTLKILPHHVALALLAISAISPSVGFYYTGKSNGRRECNEENARHQANLRLARLEALADNQHRR
jgi:hypothetical protein